MNRRQALIVAAAALSPWIDARAGLSDWVNGVKPGSRLPPFEAEYVDGPPAAERKLLLVDFWATWCAPCREEFPHLNELHTRFARRGLVVVGLSQEPASVVRAFLPKAGFQYPVGAEASLQKQLGIRALPYAVLVGRDRTIVWRGQARELAAMEIDRLLTNPNTA